MKEEGVIKYSQIWDRGALQATDAAAALLDIREQLYKHKWIGVTPDGIGYGNVSVRLNAGSFLITASQTGHIRHLHADQLSMVTAADMEQNTLWCTGLLPASSEAMSHAAIYAVLPEVQCVIHIHDRQLWQQLLHKAPTTADEIPYGTPDMAYALQELVLDMEENELLVMAGHPEGIISIGHTVETAWQTLLNWSQACKDGL